MKGWRARIGLLTPRGGPNTVAEFELGAPKGVQFVTTTLGKGSGLTVDVVEAMKARTEQAARETSTPDAIPGLWPFGGVQAIIQCGTPLGFVHGYGSDKELIKRIEAVSGVPATTHMSSVVEGLRQLQVEKVVVFAPYYPPDICEKLGKFLSDSGFNVVAITTGAGRPEIVATAPYGIYGPAKELFMKAPPADGLLLCGGGTRTFEILEALERDIRKPVTSSNQSGLWKVLNMVNVREPIHGYGQLLEMF